MAKRSLIAALLACVMLTAMIPAAVAEEKVLNLYSDRVYRTMNQIKCSDGNIFEVMGAYSEGLFRLTPDGDPELALAESYTLSEDGTVYTYKLREGLVWSNGAPVTAHDFWFAWQETIHDPDSGYGEVLAMFIVNGEEYAADEVPVEELGVKALDDLTFEITLRAPVAFFNRLITLPICFPINEEFFKAKGDQYAITADDVLYCGPFVMTDFDLAVGCTLERNPNYWDASAVKLDKVVWRVITDGSAALNAYQAGEIDRVNLSSSDVMMFTSDPEFGTYSDFRNYYIQFDWKHPTLNVNLRKAISFAIDRDILAYGVLGTGAVPAGGIVSVGIYGDGEKTFRELNGPVSRFDPELAKEYWAKGVEELGYEPKLTMLTATGTDFDTMAVFVQDQLRTNLGIEVTIDAMTQKARNEIMQAQDYDFALSAWGADYDDAMTYLELW
ncbi:MAG: peptide ABC transporter substrate-binding protein, partial [Oscillospiraceae bacterium]|nr:peptide ABC transporter substrate-binding protein [Oscillospiraceae bacterium]